MSPLDGKEFREELRAIVKLAAPVAFVQIGIVFMGVVDTIMVGHLGGEAGRHAVAAVGVGGFYVWLSVVFFWGILMALDPVIAQAEGAGDREGVALGLQRGVLLSLIFSIPPVFLLQTAEWVLPWFGQPPEVIPDAATYAALNAPGIAGWFLFTALRQTLQARHLVRQTVVCVVLANVLNAVADYALVFGAWGFPAMGVAGAAWATTASRWFMALGLLAVAWPELGPLLRPWRKDMLRWPPIAKMVRIGLPIGTQFLLEFGVFGLVLVMMGWIGADAQGGHQVAINLASLSFMVPLGISAAEAVRVGHAVGRGDPPAMRRAALGCLALGAGAMAVFAVIFLSLPAALAGIYTDKAPVISVAAILIPVAGVFQVFDGLQVVAIGILRGMADTRTPMIFNVLGFWVVGLPVSIGLGFGLDLGPAGLWWGLVAGLAAVAILLVRRVRAALRIDVRRVAIDG